MQPVDGESGHPLLVLEHPPIHDNSRPKSIARVVHCTACVLHITHLLNQDPAIVRILHESAITVAVAWHIGTHRDSMCRPVHQARTRDHDAFRGGWRHGNEKLRAHVFPLRCLVFLDPRDKPDPSKSEPSQYCKWEYGNQRNLPREYYGVD